MLLFILFIFILVVGCFFSCIITIKKRDERMRRGRRRRNKTLFEGKHLLQLAKKNTLISEGSNNIDCNTRIIECDNDSDCTRFCVKWVLEDYYNRENDAVCVNGICSYLFENSSSPCLNGGTPTSHFSFGRNVIRCVCPDGYLGKFCQISNIMIPPMNKSMTFKLQGR